MTSILKVPTFLTDLECELFVSPLFETLLDDFAEANRLPGLYLRDAHSVEAFFNYLAVNYPFPAETFHTEVPENARDLLLKTLSYYVSENVGWFIDNFVTPVTEQAVTGSYRSGLVELWFDELMQVRNPAFFKSFSDNVFDYIYFTQKNFGLSQLGKYRNSYLKEYGFLENGDGRAFKRGRFSRKATVFKLFKKKAALKKPFSAGCIFNNVSSDNRFDGTYSEQFLRWEAAAVTKNLSTILKSNYSSVILSNPYLPTSTFTALVNSTIFSWGKDKVSHWRNFSHPKHLAILCEFAVKKNNAALLAELCENPHITKEWGYSLFSAATKNWNNAHRLIFLGREPKYMFEEIINISCDMHECEVLLSSYLNTVRDEEVYMYAAHVLKEQNALHVLKNCAEWSKSVTDFLEKEGIPVLVDKIFPEYKQYETFLYQGKQKFFNTAADLFVDEPEYVELFRDPTQPLMLKEQTFGMLVYKYENAETKVNI